MLIIAVLLIAIAVHFFLPLMERQAELKARQAELRADIQKSAEELRMLRLKQEKLKTDPSFIEKIAREDLGYAKSGETVFRFADDER